MPGSILLIGSFGAEYNFNRTRQNIDVEPEGPIAYIVIIQQDALGIGGVIATRNLPEAGDSRHDLGVQSKNFCHIY
jgi:hypothetical protein